MTPEQDFVRTSTADQAVAMCQAVLAARPHCRIGQITGQPGTGKSALTEWLADEMAAIRIEVWTRISDRDLLRLIVEAAGAKGISLDATGTANSLFKRLTTVLEGRLIIVDEANHLKWAQLERLRCLSDLGKCGLILVGTDILMRTITTAGVNTYLAQLRQRIGAKRILTSPVGSDDEMMAYCIMPRFGRVSRKTVSLFRKLSGGIWRSALELGDACERLMQAEGIEKLDETVVQTAAAWMAGGTVMAFFSLSSKNEYPFDDSRLLAYSGSVQRGKLVLTLKVEVYSLRMGSVLSDLETILKAHKAPPAPKEKSPKPAPKATAKGIGRTKLLALPAPDREAEP